MPPHLLTFNKWANDRHYSVPVVHPIPSKTAWFSVLSGESQIPQRVILGYRYASDVM